MKTLVTFFSAEGNTRRVAQEIGMRLMADLYEIRPEQLYTTADINWKNPLARCNKEWSGKKVYLYATSGGSGMGKTASRLQPYMPGAEIVSERLIKSGEDVQGWLRECGLLGQQIMVVRVGAKVNKIERAGHHVHKSAHVNAPIIEEYPLTLECEVKSWDDETGILVDTIVSSQVDDSIITDGVVDLDKMQPIMFDRATGTYRTIGPVVGKAFHDGLALK